MTKPETRRMVAAAVLACESKKAEQIRILELDPADSGLTDYFLICSGTNTRQNQAISLEVEHSLKKQFDARPNSVEGYRQAEWILLDYVDFVVHIFSEEKRAFYDIERLRKTATTLTAEDLKASLVKKVAAIRKKQATKKPTAKKSVAKKSAPKKSAAKKSSAKKSTKPKAKPARSKSSAAKRMSS